MAMADQLTLESLYAREITYVRPDFVATVSLNQRDDSSDSRREPDPSLPISDH